MTIAIGSRVRTAPPFDIDFPGEWTVYDQNPETGAWKIDGGVDFDESNLIEVT